MGDLANMTDSDGLVSGPRLLRWLRSRAQMHGEAEATAREMSEPVLVAWNSSRRHLLSEMADNLERVLIPPDYPDYDGEPVYFDAAVLPTSGPEAVEDGGAEPPSDGKDTGPCEHCGRLADRVLVRDNGRVFLGCPGCAARARGDGVDLDDPALTVDEDERNQS